MTRKFPATVTPTLDASQVERLHAVADSDQAAWLVVAGIACEVIADCQQENVRPRMGELWAIIGAEVSHPANSVRQWTGVYQKCETLLADTVYQLFGYNHWSLLLALAKKQDRELEDVAQEWAASADDHGGRVVPVDVLRAALAGTGSPADPALTPLQRACDRLARAAVAVDCALALDTGTGATRRDEWAGLFPNLAAWCDEATDGRHDLAAGGADDAPEM